jgi:hypothetical protein
MFLLPKWVFIFPDAYMNSVPLTSTDPFRTNPFPIPSQSLPYPLPVGW